MMAILYTVWVFITSATFQGLYYDVQAEPKYAILFFHDQDQVIDVKTVQVMK